MTSAIRLACVIALVALAASPRARAEGDDATQARSLYEKGMAHYQLHEYEAAIDRWKAGFRLKPVPELLYNIAQAYRLSKQPENAVQFYEAYLRLSPTAANRAEVLNHIATLNKLIEQQPRTASTEPSAHPPTTDPARQAQAEAGTSGSVATPAVATTTVSSPPDKTKRRPKWLWPVVGVSAAVVVAAVVVGVVLGTRSSDSARLLPALSF